MPPGALQFRVRETMLEAGGYWRPLAALARLLEELGELAELTAMPGPEAGALDGELADLWIITAALADQFLAELPDPASGHEPASGPDDASGHDPAGGHEPRSLPGSADRSPAALLPSAGEIARVVNYYDGPKNPRQASTLPSLAAAVASFHEELDRSASALGIDLGAAVSSKLDVVRASADMQRFARERSDASTAPVLARLRAAQPDAVSLRLWGAPDGGPETVAHALRSFAKACRPERLDAFVIEPAALDGLDPRPLGLTTEPRGEFLLLRPEAILEAG